VRALAVRRLPDAKVEPSTLFSRALTSGDLAPVAGSWVLASIYRTERSLPWEVATGLPEIAEAIAWASGQDPVFAGSDGARRTAAVLVALAHHASGFRKTQLRNEGSGPRSCGLYAIRPVRGVTSSLLMLPRSASLVAIDLVRTSLEECSQLPLSDRLARYQMRGQAPDEADIRTSRSVLKEAAWLLK
jgi:hypothetical protein